MLVLCTADCDAGEIQMHTMFLVVLLVSTVSVYYCIHLAMCHRFSFLLLIRQLKIVLPRVGPHLFLEIKIKLCDHLHILCVTH